MPNARITTAIIATACLSLTAVQAHAQKCDLSQYRLNLQGMQADDAKGRLARTLRDTAASLRDEGYDAACGQTLAALDQLIGRQQQSASTQGQRSDGATGSGTQRRQMLASDEVPTDVKRLMANATPLLETGGDVSFEKLMGLTVYSSNGQNLGEVEDIVIDIDAKRHQAVIGLGGFLNLGETRVLVPLQQLRIGPDRQSVFVAFTENEAEAQPVVEWREGSWREAQG